MPTGQRDRTLAIVFSWFGALKTFGVSPVNTIVASTDYFFEPDWFVPVLGVVEVAVGVGLALRVGMRLVLAVLLAQMLGTFLVFVMLPELAFQDGNSLLLTTAREFVLKNLVLLGAALVVGSQVGEFREEIGRNRRCHTALRVRTRPGRGGLHRRRPMLSSGSLRSLRESRPRGR